MDIFLDVCGSFGRCAVLCRLVRLLAWTDEGESLHHVLLGFVFQLSICRLTDDAASVMLEKQRVTAKGHMCMTLSTSGRYAIQQAYKSLPWYMQIC